MENTQDRQVHHFSYEHISKVTRMPLITVYNSPTDYPGKFVARLWDIDKPTAFVATADTLDELRDSIPDAMHRLDRRQDDDPCIVEVWI